MPDLASERESAAELVIGARRRLSVLDPDNKLLRYMDGLSVDGSFRYAADKAIRNEFIENYTPDERTPVAVILTRYYVDLLTTIDQIEWNSNRSRPSPQPASGVRGGDFWDDDDDLF